MWFKNLQVFRLKESFEYTQDQLEQQLAAARFRHCGSQELGVQGWHPPLGGSEQLCFASNGCFLLCLRREEKILPASVVNDMLAEKVEQIEAEEARSVNRREKKQLKEDIFMGLLPRAFSRCRARSDWNIQCPDSSPSILSITERVAKGLPQLTQQKGSSSYRVRISARASRSNSSRGVIQMAFSGQVRVQSPHWMQLDSMKRSWGFPCPSCRA